MLLEAEVLGDAVSEADALPLDELAAEDEGATTVHRGGAGAQGRAPQ